MKAVIDTNVLLVANQKHPDVSPECIAECVKRLQAIKHLDHRRGAMPARTFGLHQGHMIFILVICLKIATGKAIGEVENLIRVPIVQLQYRGPPPGLHTHTG